MDINLLIYLFGPIGYSIGNKDWKVIIDGVAYFKIPANQHPNMVSIS